MVFLPLPPALLSPLQPNSNPSLKPYPGGVPHAPPPTEREKRLVQIHRDMLARKHASPFYTGPPGTLAKVLVQAGTKRSAAAADFNAFEDQPTYGRKFARREFRFPDLKKHKFAAPQLFPKELWATIGYDPNADPDSLPKRKLGLAKKGVVDRLARFDEDNADGAGAEEEEEVIQEAEDEEGLEAPQDDDFEEDEEDDNNDYNAEQYFDGGEDDFEEGGDEGGGYGEDGY
jgi:DNA-directed RNA polymerase III subunit RPC7